MRRVRTVSRILRVGLLPGIPSEGHQQRPTVRLHARPRQDTRKEDEEIGPINSVMAGTIHQGRRWTSVTEYLAEAAAKYPDRLHVLIDSLATQVTFNQNRATAVKIRREDGREVTVRARKEIILSAGAIQTPQLLMLSGIGPRQHLAHMGIPLVADLPVGDNLMDHVSTYLQYDVDDSVGTTFAESLDPRVWARYFTDFSGPPGNSIVEVQGRMPRPNNRFGNVGFSFTNQPTVEPGSFQRVYNWKDRTVNLNFDGVGELRKSGFMILVYQSQTQSRGFLRLNSTNPEAHPLIQPHYFIDEEDLDALVDGIRLANQIASSPPMRRLGARLHLPDFPECRPPTIPKSVWRPNINSTYYLKCWLLITAFSTHHPAGTAKMGQRGRLDTVVDPDFKVVGVDGLRVVDASIFPEHISGTPMATILGIANMAADIILQQRRPGKSERDHQDQGRKGDAPWWRSD